MEIDIIVTVHSEKDKDTILVLFEEAEANDLLPPCSVESKVYNHCDYCDGRCICD